MLLLILMALLLGCSSMKSTFLDRDQMGNGLVEAKLDGYPITLKVPTHLQITLYENSFLQPGIGADEDGDGEADGEAGWEVVKVDGRPLRNLSYGTLLIETDKIFTVDHKRPAAGQMKFSVDFTEDQYIDAISSAATEDTIRQASIATARTASLFQGITPAPRTSGQYTRTLEGSQAAFVEIDGASNKTRPERKEEFIGTTALHAATNTKALSSVLASQIFEIDDPEFELKVSCFLQDALHRTCR